MLSFLFLRSTSLRYRLHPDVVLYCCYDLLVLILMDIVLLFFLCVILALCNLVPSVVVVFLFPFDLLCFFGLYNLYLIYIFWILRRFFLFFFVLFFVVVSVFAFVESFIIFFYFIFIFVFVCFIVIFTFSFIFFIFFICYFGVIPLL